MPNPKNPNKPMQPKGPQKKPFDVDRPNPTHDLNCEHRLDALTHSEFQLHQTSRVHHDAKS